MAVIAKDDCRVFCYINSLGDKISNTAALIQPNPFLVLGKISLFFHVFPQIASILVWEGPKDLKSRSTEENVRNGHIYIIQLMKQNMT